MKINTYIIVSMLVLGLTLFQLVACSSTNQFASKLYWDVNSSGTIDTNDVTRLQKEVPFTITLPGYLPDGSKSYNLEMIFYYYDQIPTLSFYLRSLLSAREININENPPADPYPRPLPPGFLAEMNPDYTPLELAGVEVLEKNSFDDVYLSGQWIEVSGFLYIWEQNNIQFGGSIMGYDQSESRKIIESMIR